MLSVCNILYLSPSLSRTQAAADAIKFTVSSSAIKSAKAESSAAAEAMEASQEEKGEKKGKGEEEVKPMVCPMRRKGAPEEEECMMCSG